MHETEHDALVSAALDRYVPAAGWTGDWSSIAARAEERHVRGRLAVAGPVLAALVALALVSFVLVLGSRGLDTEPASSPMYGVITTSMDTSPTVTEASPLGMDGQGDRAAARRFLASVGSAATEVDPNRRSRLLPDSDGSSVIRSVEPVAGRRRYAYDSREGLVCLTTAPATRSTTGAVCLPPTAVEAGPLIASSVMASSACSPGRPAEEDVFALLPRGVTAVALTSDRGDHPIHTDARTVYSSLPVTVSNARLRWTDASEAARSSLVWREAPDCRPTRTTPPTGS